MQKVEMMLYKNCLKLYEEDCKNYKIVDKKLIVYTGDSEYCRIPSGVEEIKSSAFRNKKIERVFIPKEVEKIETGAFENCPNLCDIYRDTASKVRKECFVNCPKISLVEEENKVLTHWIDFVI